MKYKEWKEYRCIKLLTLKQLYLPPNMQDKATIQPGTIWYLVNFNKIKDIVTLENKELQPAKMQCRISFECFKEYFEEVAEWTKQK